MRAPPPAGLRINIGSFNEPSPHSEYFSLGVPEKVDAHAPPVKLVSPGDQRLSDVWIKSMRPKYNMYRPAFLNVM